MYTEGKRAVLNRGRGNKFEESTCSSVCCRVSTLKKLQDINVQRKHRPNFDDETTVYLFETERRFNNCFNLHVHKEPAECISLEDAAQE